MERRLIYAGVTAEARVGTNILAGPFHHSTVASRLLSACLLCDIIS
jgi:hypothetical protein